MKWITRERPKMDRIACPWLNARFIDKSPEFLFVPADQVHSPALATGAIPSDVPGVELTHDGPLCSFDAILKSYKPLIPVCKISRWSFVGPIRRGPIWHLNVRVCSRSRSGCRTTSPTITSS